MEDQPNRIEELHRKLNLLLSQQKVFAQEIQSLYQEIQKLKKSESNQASSEDKKVVPPALGASNDLKEQIPPKVAEKVQIEDFVKPQRSSELIDKKTVPKEKKSNSKSNLEKFIGENLINKIGIAILIIGVAIGARYSIENNLISPLTRIILGYLSGLGLLSFGIKLKAKYENYSAVLVSGALAILYVITFLAYSFYNLFPQLMAFGLMLVFTFFGVVAALNYNKQVIAHIGLVGAYAIPFLLSNNSGNAIVLFSYVAIINIGILTISFKKNWKPLHYAAFIFTWLIYTGFSAFSYETEKHFQMALLFLCIFFVQFYTIFLAYKLIANEKFKKSDVVLLLLNSFIFFGLGYGLLNYHSIGKELIGVFTLCNAVIHFIVSVVLFKKKLADRNLFYLVSGMVLVFITIAIPVQLDGNWVTQLWALEAALLFWIGRSKNVSVYEKLSYPLMILAFFSLLQDWDSSYKAYLIENHLNSFFNITFLTSIIFVVAFGFINWVHRNERLTLNDSKQHWMSTIMAFGIPFILLLSIYGAFYLEIEYYFDKQYWLSRIEIPAVTGYTFDDYNYDLRRFGNIWLLNYTLFFITVMAFQNIKILKNRVFGIVILGIGSIATLLFLTAGLYIISELRQSYLNEDLSRPFETSTFNITIRYIAIGFFALLMFSLYRLSKASFMKLKAKVPFDALLHISILWILSSELLQWMDLARSSQTYKLGLSILWGVYSLFLIALGIYRNSKYLRIGAMILFGITLIKLFFYDIASMNTITKTIVFVSLGILLLIISFLYNKYKHKIADEPDQE